MVAITRWSYYWFGRKAGFNHKYSPGLPSHICNWFKWLQLTLRSEGKVDASTSSTHFSHRKGRNYDHNMLYSDCLSSFFKVYFLTILPCCNVRETTESNQHALHFPAQTKSRLSLSQASQRKQDMQISKYIIFTLKNENCFAWLFWSQNLTRDFKTSIHHIKDWEQTI